MRAHAAGGLLLVVMAVSAGCGPKTMDARMRDAERTADKASTALDEAERHAEALEPDKMQRSLDEAQKLLLDKDVSLHPEAQMHIDRYQELRARQPAVKAEREKKDLEKKLDDARDAILPRSRAATEALGQLSQTNPTSAQCETAENRVKDLKAAFDGSKELFAKDADFAAWARGEHTKGEKGLEAIARCKRGVAFLEGPVAAWRNGVTLHKDARKVKDAEAKVKVLSDARTDLSKCARDAKPFETDAATAAVAFVMPAGKPQTPAQLHTVCDKALKAADADLKKASAAAKKAAKKKK